MQRFPNILSFTAGYYWSKQEMPHIQLDVDVVFEGKMEKLQLIEDGGHKYIKIQDLLKFGYKVEGNESQVIIKK